MMTDKIIGYIVGLVIMDILVCVIYYCLKIGDDK